MVMRIAFHEDDGTRSQPCEPARQNRVKYTGTPDGLLADFLDGNRTPLHIQPPDESEYLKPVPVSPASMDAPGVRG